LDGLSRQRLWRAIADRVDRPGHQGWAHAICATCVAVLSGVDGAALTMRGDGGIQELLGASDDWAARLDEAQFMLGEGPGARAYQLGEAVLVPAVGADPDRWPGFVDVALAAGTGGVYAFPLQMGGIRLGTLDLYRRPPGELPSSELVDAAVLAELATVALLEHADRSGGDWLRSATSYQDVNVATGMLAAQLGVGLGDAFARLRAHAFAADRSVVEVAQDVLARRLRLDGPVG
jgi:hypothetical protein